ncbi:hypothetical protein OG730_44035 (plasmid) [Streptomyces sp. NBC_01298]|nr:hypothetical protein OG730_44140 [Streptomyces sp. NBC_01298]WSK26341.1 hypothetical protein OG730_44035 [Streptomyces sp. NBC_01298]
MPADDEYFMIAESQLERLLTKRREGTLTLDEERTLIAAQDAITHPRP